MNPLLTFCSSNPTFDYHSSNWIPCLFLFFWLNIIFYYFVWTFNILSFLKRWHVFLCSIHLSKKWSGNHLVIYSILNPNPTKVLDSLFVWHRTSLDRISDFRLYWALSIRLKNLLESENNFLHPSDIQNIRFCFRFGFEFGYSMHMFTDFHSLYSVYNIFDRIYANNLEFPKKKSLYLNKKNIHWKQKMYLTYVWRMYCFLN